MSNHAPTVDPVARVIIVLLVLAIVCAVLVLLQGAGMCLVR